MSLAAALAATTLLLSACVTATNYNAEVKKSAAYEQVDAQLKSEITASKLRLEQLQNVVKLTLATSLLFTQGGGELDDAGKALLIKLAPALKNLPGKRIVISAYTDNLPIGPELIALFPGNIELSKARAEAVARLLVEQGVARNIISTVGLGASHPVADNNTPEGRAKNRRVELDIVDAPL